jgi:4-hydroxy-3-polyprenylbenzoate decarboxylase
MPGVIVLQGPAYESSERDAFMVQIEESLARWKFRENYPWISIVDSAPILDGSLDMSNIRDFLWITFTRSDPAKDVFGYRSQIREKHWGCAAPLMVDARIKPHHQKALTVPEEIRKRAHQVLEEEKVFGGV